MAGQRHTDSHGGLECLNGSAQTAVLLPAASFKKHGTHSHTHHYNGVENYCHIHIFRNMQHHNCLAFCIPASCKSGWFGMPSLSMSAPKSNCITAAMVSHAVAHRTRVAIARWFCIISTKMPPTVQQSVPYCRSIPLATQNNTL